MKCVFIFIILFALFIAVITPASANDFVIRPERPIAGDTITIEGSTSENKPVHVSIDFEKTEKISPGNREFIYMLNFENPIKSSFSVTATKVENLNVGVKILVWWTLRSKANSEKVATIAHNDVPKGTYQIRLGGTAAPGQSSVVLKIKATSLITSDNNGKFVYSYKTTKDFPAGTYNLNIDGATRSITLLSRSEKHETQKPENEETGEDGLKENNDKISGDPTSTPETTEIPEIKETYEKAPESRPAPSSDQVETTPPTLLQKVLNFFKFW